MKPHIPYRMLTYFHNKQYPILNMRKILFHWILLGIFPFIFLYGCASDSNYDATAGWSAQKIYDEAKKELESGGWTRAIKLYETLESKYPFGLLAQQAQMDIIYAHWKNSNLPLALASADRFIKLYPNHTRLDYILYLKGVINFHEDRGLLSNISLQDPSERDNRAARESFDTFKELLQRFPNSHYAEDSTLRLNYLLNSLARYEIHVARYYMKRGAWVAALNRGQAVLNNYPNTSIREEALHVMIESYRALGLTDLAVSTQKILDLNYPNSDIATRPKTADDPWWKLW